MKRQPIPARIVLFGCGGHAKVVLEAILAHDPASEVAILDDRHSESAALLGRAVVGPREWLAANWPDAPVVAALGNNTQRAELMAWLSSHGRRLETVIHPRAVVSPSAGIGDGCFLAAGAIVNAEARVGPGVIINTGASVDHDCELREAAHIAPGARLCGGVRVGRRSLIGVGSVVVPGVAVGEDATVGAGSTVIADVPAGALVAGCPARSIRRA